MKKVQLRYCKHCDATMPCEKRSPNHVLHIILSVLTIGLWLVVYALMAIESSGHSWRCQKCGTKC